MTRYAAVLCAVILIGESALAVWRWLPVEPSQAALLSYPPARPLFEQPGDFAATTQIYGADRGARETSEAADGVETTIFYFEWDKIRFGPRQQMTNHAPEECNVAAGFELLALHSPRHFHSPNRSPLIFDASSFLDPSGRPLHVFKLLWFQGLGSRLFREGTRRGERLTNSFVRLEGAARVLQISIQGAPDLDSAWTHAQNKVLSRLEWVEPQGPAALTAAR